MAHLRVKGIALIALGFCLTFNCGCSRSRKPSVVEASSTPSGRGGERETPPTFAEMLVEPRVRAEIGKLEEEKRAALLKGAEAAIAETRNALAAVAREDKPVALAALERASAMLNAITSRDPELAFAPIDVSTSVIDLYASPEMVKRAVDLAKEELSVGQIQDARHLMSALASEADVHVVAIPLATYPGEIQTAVPLIAKGEMEEAKAALTAALHNLVVETYVIPLPKLRAQALLDQAELIAAKLNRTPADNNLLHELVGATRNKIQLAEVLGYGSGDDYQQLYAQLDDVEKKAQSGESAKGLFEKIERSLRNFKVSRLELGVFASPRAVRYFGLQRRNLVLFN